MTKRINEKKEKWHLNKEKKFCRGKQTRCDVWGGKRTKYRKV
jgi:hypothetical protein